MGKGSKPRPTAVPTDTLSANWERVFPPKEHGLVCTRCDLAPLLCRCKGFVTFVEASD